jgi:hypothetical protein
MGTSRKTCKGKEKSQKRFDMKPAGPSKTVRGKNNLQVIEFKSRERK